MSLFWHFLLHALALCRKRREHFGRHHLGPNLSFLIPKFRIACWILSTYTFKTWNYNYLNLKWRRQRQNAYYWLVSSVGGIWRWRRKSWGFWLGTDLYPDELSVVWLIRIDWPCCPAFLEQRRVWSYQLWIFSRWIFRFKFLWIWMIHSPVILSIKYFKSGFLKFQIKTVKIQWQIGGKNLNLVLCPDLSSSSFCKHFPRLAEATKRQ